MMNVLENTTFNITNTEGRESNIPVGTILHICVQVLLFCVGLFIQIKIISVCWKKKEGKTWQIHMTHSIFLIISFSLAIPFDALTHFIPSLHKHTGYWFCYGSAFLTCYFLYSLTFNSLVIAVMKYMFIVRDKTVLKFGEENTKKAFFGINLGLPLFLAIVSTVTVDVDIHTSLNSCFGQKQQVLTQYNTSAGSLEKLFLCTRKNSDAEDSEVYILYVIKQCVCAITSTLTLLIVSNLPEAFFYYKIFQKMQG